MEYNTKSQKSRKMLLFLVIGCRKERNYDLMSTNTKKKLNLHTSLNVCYDTLEGIVGNMMM